MRRSIPLLSMAVVLLAACIGGGTERTQTTSPGISPSGPTTADSPTASPLPELRTDWSIPPFHELVRMFDYDASQPLDFTEVSQIRVHGATVHVIEYRSSGHVVKAELVLPEGTGPFPVVLYAPGSRAGTPFFQPDAVALARDGYAGLIVIAPESRPPYLCLWWDCLEARRNIRAFVAWATDLRRGVDLLQTLPAIDAGRVGFVGHDEGGVVGSILSGVDARIDAYVLQVAEGYWTDWIRILHERGEGYNTDEGRLTHAQLVRYQERIAVLNPVNYIGHSQGAAFLFQGAEAEETLTGLTRANFLALFEAAPEPKILRWYEGDVWLGCAGPGHMSFHSLIDVGGCDPSVPAFVDHRAWLGKNV